MKWYDDAAAKLEKDRIYSRKELTEILQENYPYVSSNSYQWAIGELVKAGKLTKTGYSQYQVLTASNPRKLYIPQYSETARAVINLLKTQMTPIKIVLFETALLNEFLPDDKRISDNVIYVEVEKGHSDEVFLFLQKEGIPRLVRRPTPKAFQFYKTKDSVVITDLSTRSPTVRKHPFEICLEKLLVDIYCDRLIKMAYSFEDYAGIASAALNMYFVDKPTMVRYAERKRKKAELLHDFPGLAENKIERNELKVKLLFEAVDVIMDLPDERKEFFKIITSGKTSQYEYAQWEHVTPQAITNRIISLYGTIIRILSHKYEYSEAQLQEIIGYKDRLDLLKTIRYFGG